MPRGDGTGPDGQGPMTGKKMGLCGGNATAGCGRGLSRGMGRGKGTGQGLGMALRHGKQNSELADINKRLAALEQK